MSNSSKPFRVSPFAKAAMSLQVFLMRRNWMPGMSEQVMIITTTGRKSGKPFSTPIGFLRDGNSYLALNNGGRSNWYKNVQQNPEVTLEIKGQIIRARGEPVTDKIEKHKIFKMYLQERASNFERYFGVPANAPKEALNEARDSREFMRFYPIK